MGYHHMQLTDEQLNLLYSLLERVEGHNYTLSVLKEALSDMGGKITKTPVFSGKIEILQGKFLSWNELEEYGEYEVFNSEGMKFGFRLLKTHLPDYLTHYYYLYHPQMKMEEVDFNFLKNKYFRKIE